jgi:hypothetical protein
MTIRVVIWIDGEESEHSLTVPSASAKIVRMALAAYAENGVNAAHVAIKGLLGQSVKLWGGAHQFIAFRRGPTIEA